MTPEQMAAVLRGLAPYCGTQAMVWNGEPIPGVPTTGAALRWIADYVETVPRCGWAESGTCPAKDAP